MVALGRRLFVGGAAALGTTALWPMPPGRAATSMGFDEARHLLSRAGLGATPAEIRAIEPMDYSAAVDRLLATWRPRALTPPPDWIGESPVQLRRQEQEAQTEAQNKKGVDGKPLRITRPVQEQARELRNWWVEELLTTDQPLVERMTLFWHNHFTSSLLKVRYAPAMYRQNELFRREAFGNFARLLKAVARDPAMLLYLDGAGSVARQPNENFARELLELFTLGEGHYTEADVKNAARAFTGRSMDRESGAFVERAPLHDGGEKTFLGQTGRFTGDNIVALLLRHPRTAELVCAKLWREFVSLVPDPAEIKRLAAILRDGDYEMKPVLRAMFLSPAFRSADNRGTLIKSPVDLVIGSVRLLGLPVPEKTQLVRMLQGLGQVPLDPPNVKGWPGGESWITSYTLMLRQQFMRRMIEASTVTSMDGNPRGMRPDRRADRTEMMEPPRAVEGRSLRGAGGEARLGSTLVGVDAAALVRTLLPRQPLDPVETGRTPGVIVAAAMLDPVYQLK